MPTNNQIVQKGCVPNPEGDHSMYKSEPLHFFDGIDFKQLVFGPVCVRFCFGSKSQFAIHSIDISIVQLAPLVSISKAAPSQISINFLTPS